MSRPSERRRCPPPEFRLFQDVEQIGHWPALEEGGRQVLEVQGLRLLLKRGDGQTAFARFRGEDLDLRVGWEGCVECGEGSVHLPAQVLDEDAAILRLAKRVVIGGALAVKVVWEVLIRVAKACGAFDPHFFAAYLLAQCPQHTQLVRDAIDVPAGLVVQHEILPGLFHDTVERHGLGERDTCDGTVPVGREEFKGLHHGTVHLVVAPEGQCVEQCGHHAPIVVAIGGACHQPDLPGVILVGVGLADQGIQRLFANGGVNNLLDHAVRLAFSSLGQLVEKPCLAHHLLDVLSERGVHLLFRFHPNAVGAMQEQLHQGVGNLPLPLPTQRGQQRIA